MAENHAHQEVRFRALEAVYHKIGATRMKKTKIAGKTLWDMYTALSAGVTESE